MMTDLSRSMLMNLFKSAFKQTLLQGDDFSDYDIYFKVSGRITADGMRIHSVEVDKAYGRKHGRVEELPVQFAYSFEEGGLGNGGGTLPEIGYADILQFSDLDKEGNRYRYSGHLSFVGSNLMLTLNVRKIVPVQNADVLPEVERLALQMLSTGGLLLIGGRYGHGKTTLAYYLMRKYIEKFPKRGFIITIEDPIEGVLPAPAKQMEMPSEFWVNSLRAVMREKPDVVFVGEILTPQMADVLMQYASTGLPVITTIHASSTAHIFARLKSLLQASGNPQPERTIANAITGTIYVEFPPYENAKQLAEVVWWKKIKLPAVMSQYIRDNLIENIYKEDAQKRDNALYILTLWHSAQRRGYQDLANRIQQECLNLRR